MKMLFAPGHCKLPFLSLNYCWGDEIDLFKNGLCSTFFIVNACAQAAFLVGDVTLLTMALKRSNGMAGNQQCKI